MRGTLPAVCFLGLLGSFMTMAASSMASSVPNLPPEIAVIGSPNRTLPVTFPFSSGECDMGNDAVVVPGEYLTAAETQNPPHLSIANFSLSYESNLNSTAKFVFLMVDPDYNTTSPTNVGLHTLYANVTTEGQFDTYSEICKYVAPDPHPIGSTHNYTLLLFPQPDAQFLIPEKYASFVATNADTPYNRINFPLVQFIEDTGLGKPLAANWFREKSSSSADASSSLLPVTSATSAPVSSKGCSTTIPSTGASATPTASGTAPATTASHTGLAVRVHNARDVSVVVGCALLAVAMNGL